MALTDNFNRANAVLSSPWATQTSETGCEIVSNLIAVTDIFGTHGSRRTDSWDAAHSSQAVAQDGSGAYRELSVRVRCQSGARSYYAGGMENFNLGSQHYRIWKVIAGTYTNLIEHGSQDLAATDVVKLTVSGSTLTLFVNTVQVLTITDSDLSGGTPGLGTANGGTVNAWDNWEGTGESASGGGRLIGTRLISSALLNGLVR